MWWFRRRGRIWRTCSRSVDDRRLAASALVKSRLAGRRTCVLCLRQLDNTSRRTAGQTLGEALTTTNPHYSTLGTPSVHPHHLTAVPSTTEDSEPRPGSRAARIGRPLAKAVLYGLAE